MPGKSFLPAIPALLALVFTGCGILAPDPANIINRVQIGYQAITPIPPTDTAKAFLDSASLAFDAGKSNTLEYEGTRDHMLGGLGPDYQDFSLILKSMKTDSSKILISASGWISDTATRASPPVHYHKDSLADTLEASGYYAMYNFAVEAMYPSNPRVVKGVFVSDQIGKMLVIGASGTRYFRIYLEPYGLIYYLQDNTKFMESNYTEFWIKRCNGVELDRNRVFGLVKGLIQAYSSRQ